MDTPPEPGRPDAGAEPGADSPDAASDAAADLDSTSDSDSPEDAAEAGAEAADGQNAGKDPLRFNKWMKRSATGAVMTGIAVGLREALEPRRPEVGFVIEASDPDEPDGPIEMRFDPDSPQNTVAVIRRSPPEPEADDGTGGQPPA